jgi:hypothetical protein
VELSVTSKREVLLVTTTGSAFMKGRGSRRAAVNKKWSPTRPSKSTSAMSWSLARPQSQTKSATEKLSARERMALRAMAMTD